MTSRFPVILLYKEGSKLDPGNYRPFSILSSLSKIIEKIILNRLTNTYLHKTYFMSSSLASVNLILQIHVYCF